MDFSLCASCLPSVLESCRNFEQNTLGYGKASQFIDFLLLYFCLQICIDSVQVLSSAKKI